MLPHLPDGRHEELADTVRVFERNYGLISNVRRSVSNLLRVIPALKASFDPSATVNLTKGTILQKELDAAQQHLDSLVDMEIVTYSAEEKDYVVAVNGPMGSSAGFEYEFVMQIQPLYSTISREVMEDT